MTVEEKFAWQKLEKSRKIVFQAEANEKWQAQSPKQRLAFIIVLAVVICAVFFGVFRMCSHIYDPETIRSSDIEYLISPSPIDGAIPCCKEYLERSINDWSSYESIEWSTPIESPQGQFTVLNKFRAKNGFGAYRIAIYSFVYTKNGVVLSANQVQ